MDQILLPVIQPELVAEVGVSQRRLMRFGKGRHDRLDRILEGAELPWMEEARPEDRAQRPVAKE